MKNIMILYFIRNQLFHITYISFLSVKDIQRAILIESQIIKIK